MDPRDPNHAGRLWLLAFFVVAAVVFSAPARASTPRDAERAAWYLKGEGDVIFEPRGWTMSKLTCRPTSTAYVACVFRLNSKASPSLCSHGRFRLAHFRVDGQWSPPHVCGAPSA